MCKHLLKHGWKVRALVRNPNKPKAQELRSLGAQLAVGDLDKPETIPPALTGITHAFVNTVYDLAFVGLVDCFFFVFCDEIHVTKSEY